MKIRKMTASFGSLQNSSMTLAEGLNIIQSPNESGKSTWCAFIKSMLYGIDSSAREKAGVKPDKVKFAPWSGAPMCGTMDIEFSGREITLSRQGRDSAPMRTFTAVYTGTSENAGIPQGLVGETLLGVPREVFERSAFIGQGDVAIGQTPELERRIAAIVQTGDQGCSATEAEERLRTAMRRRRYNRSGRLPEIETELAEIRGTLMEIEGLEHQAADLAAARQQALSRRDRLTEVVAGGRRELRRRSLEELSCSRSHFRELEALHDEKAQSAMSAEATLKSTAFGLVAPELAKKQVELLHRRHDAALACAKEGHFGIALVAALLAVAATAGLALAVDFGLFSLGSKFASYLPAMAAGLLSCFLLVRLALLQKNRKSRLNQAHDILQELGCRNTDELAQLLSVHSEAYSKYIAAVDACDAAAANISTAKDEIDAFDAKMLDLLDFSQGDSQQSQDNRNLDAAEADLRKIREELAAVEGRKSGLGNFAELSSRLEALLAEHDKLSTEYEALVLALDTIKTSGEEIQRRITPRLSHRTAEYFAKLTGERYDEIALDRQLNATVRLAGDAVSHEAAFLSRGALEQLYLAVRLAICELALPEETSAPLILDDALVNFDDRRCFKALDVILELSKTRQVLLFSCHGREAEYLKSRENVRILSI